MSRRESEIVQRLKTAYKRTREAYEDTFKGHDLHPGTEIAGAWPFITAAYSGIEQTFKFHIAEAHGQTVEELVATRGPKGAKGEARYPYRHHNLGRLFVCLEEPIRVALAEQYRQFRTLQPYIQPATAGEFLNVVSAEDGRGYERWRHSLKAPEKKIQTNSAEALLSIWDIAVQLSETGRRGWRLRGVYEQLSEVFAWRLEEIVEKLNMERVGKGLPFHDVRRESIEWMSAHGGPLNAFAELTHRAQRGLLPDADADGLSAFFGESLKAWVLARDGGVVEARSDVRAFVARATGYRGPGQGVRWNRETNGFEDVPWELDQITADELPPGGFRFEEDYRGTRRHQKKSWVFGRGFEVKENHPAQDDMPAGKWLCTLCGEKAVATGGKLIVRFWQHADDEDGFHVDVDGGEDSKEERLVREVMRLGSEFTRGEGAYIVEAVYDSKRSDDEPSTDCSAS